MVETALGLNEAGELRLKRAESTRENRSHIIEVWPRSELVRAAKWPEVK